MLKSYCCAVPKNVAENHEFKREKISETFSSAAPKQDLKIIFKWASFNLTPHCASLDTNTVFIAPSSFNNACFDTSAKELGHGTG